MGITSLLGGVVQTCMFQSSANLFQPQRFVLVDMSLKHDQSQKKVVCMFEMKIGTSIVVAEDVAEIQAYVDSGKATADTEARLVGSHDWSKLGRVKGLKFPDKGRPSSRPSSMASGASVRSKEASSLADLACPTCRTLNVQRLSITYAGGITTSVGRVSGVGIDLDGDVGYATGTTVSTNQNALSALAAPPMPPKEFCGLAGFLGILLGMSLPTICIFIYINKSQITNISQIPSNVVSLYWGSVVVLSVLGIFFIYRRFQARYNNQLLEWSEQKSRWDRSFICLKCAHIFQV